MFCQHCGDRQVVADMASSRAMRLAASADAASSAQDTPEFMMIYDVPTIVCPGCGIATYCSESCRQADWLNGHADFCEFISTAFGYGSVSGNVNGQMIGGDVMTETSVENGTIPIAPPPPPMPALRGKSGISEKSMVVRASQGAGGIQRALTRMNPSDIRRMLLGKSDLEYAAKEARDMAEKFDAIAKREIAKSKERISSPGTVTKREPTAMKKAKSIISASASMAHDYAAFLYSKASILDQASKITTNKMFDSPVECLFTLFKEKWDYVLDKLVAADPKKAITTSGEDSIGGKSPSDGPGSGDMTLRQQGVQSGQSAVAKTRSVTQVEFDPRLTISIKNIYASWLLWMTKKNAIDAFWLKSRGCSNETAKDFLIHVNRFAKETEQKRYDLDHKDSDKLDDRPSVKSIDRQCESCGSLQTRNFPSISAIEWEKADMLDVLNSRVKISKVLKGFADKCMDNIAAEWKNALVIPPDMDMLRTFSRGKGNPDVSTIISDSAMAEGCLASRDVIDSINVAYATEWINAFSMEKMSSSQQQQQVMSIDNLTIPGDSSSAAAASDAVVDSKTTDAVISINLRDAMIAISSTTAPIISIEKSDGRRDGSPTPTKKVYEQSQLDQALQGKLEKLHHIQHTPQPQVPVVDSTMAVDSTMVIDSATIVSAVAKPSVPEKITVRQQSLENETLLDERFYTIAAICSHTWYSTFTASERKKALASVFTKTMMPLPDTTMWKNVLKVNGITSGDVEDTKERKESAQSADKLEKDKTTSHLPSPLQPTSSSGIASQPIDSSTDGAATFRGKIYAAMAIAYRDHAVLHEKMKTLYMSANEDTDPFCITDAVIEAMEYIQTGIKLYNGIVSSLYEACAMKTNTPPAIAVSMDDSVVSVVASDKDVKPTKKGDDGIVVDSTQSLLVPTIIATPPQTALLPTEAMRDETLVDERKSTMVLDEKSISLCDKAWQNVSGAIGRIQSTIDGVIKSEQLIVDMLGKRNESNDLKSCVHLVSDMIDELPELVNVAVILIIQKYSELCHRESCNVAGIQSPANAKNVLRCQYGPNKNAVKAARILIGNIKKILPTQFGTLHGPRLRVATSGAKVFAAPVAYEIRKEMDHKQQASTSTSLHLPEMSIKRLVDDHSAGNSHDTVHPKTDEHHQATDELSDVGVMRGLKRRADDEPTLTEPLDTSESTATARYDIVLTACERRMFMEIAELIKNMEFKTCPSTVKQCEDAWVHS